MNIPKYTETEERLLRENRDLRDKIRKLDRENYEQISHTGVWIRRLEEKARQVCELEEALARMQNTERTNGGPDL